ncbi:hypothetical protein [Vreelandella andesensis]|uniref:hypothetical protein n=1 Tax=Vreelandella andesensis TaxID=447567 RepID=UPI001FC920A3|nr:hypothetical protein [Halomonas andesensis]
MLNPPALSRDEPASSGVACRKQVSPFYRVAVGILFADSPQLATAPTVFAFWIMMDLGTRQLRGQESAPGRLLCCWRHVGDGQIFQLGLDSRDVGIYHLVQQADWQDIILSQYLQCFEKLRSGNVVIRNGAWFWRVEGGKDDKVDDDDSNS